MLDRDDALESLRRRIGRAVQRGSAGVLFTVDTVRCARDLTAAVDPMADPEGAHALGVYHWMRYLDSENDEELVEALRFLAPVHDVSPDDVPEPLRALLEGRGIAGLMGDAFDLGLTAIRAYERGRHLTVLRRAVELCRTAMTGPFDHSFDRAMAQNNLGYVLRLTYEQFQDAGVLDESVALAREAVTATGHPGYALTLHNLGVALLHLYWRDKKVEILGEAIAAARLAVVTAGPAHPELMGYQDGLALALFSWADVTSDAAAATEAIELARAVITTIPAGDPKHTWRLYMLGFALRQQYERTGETDCLVEAVVWGREAVAATPDDHSSRGERLTKLNVALLLLFEKTGDLAVAREGIAAARAAVDATPVDAADRATPLHNLGTWLRTMAELSSHPDTAAEAVAVARAAVEAVTDEDPRPQDGLSMSLVLLYERTRDMRLLLEAVDICRAAVEAGSPESPHRALQLVNLTKALFSLFEAVGNDDLLDEVIAASREALAALPPQSPHRAVAMTNLGAALAGKYERDGNIEPAAEAVVCTQAALDATPAGHPDRIGRLNNLGMAQHALSRCTGGREPLEEGLLALREAVAVTEVDHPMRGTVLNGLAALLEALGQHTGDIELLREAAEATREAVETTPAHHPHHAVHLNARCLVLQNLSWHTGDSAPLAAAIEAGRKAVAATPDGHANRPSYLANLGTALHSSYMRTGRAEDIDEAISLGREAVAATPEGHPRHVPHLIELADSLTLRALHEKDAEALDEGITLGRRAATASDTSVLRRRVLTSLAGALRLRSARAQDPAPLYEAITATREALALGALPLRPALLSDHAHTLHLLFSHTGDPDLVDEILTCSRSAAADASAAVSSRVASYRRIAAVTPRDGTGAVDACAAAESTVALLPQIGLGDLDLGDRGREIGGVGFSLAGAVAAAALEAGRACRAVELLEQSRGVLTAESLAAEGADLDRLRSAAPELASAFEELRIRREILDRPAPETVAVQNPPEARAAARRDAQTAWSELLDRIRALNGFSAFLAPPQAAELTTQAAEGPVVYLCSAPTRCDALVLTGDPHDPVHVVPLDRLTEKEAIDRIVSLSKAVEAAGDPAVDPVARRAAQGDILGLLAWLWDTVTDPVLTALGHTDPPEPGKPWPRVWWCPVGILAYLPLHVAGHHEDLADDSPHRDAPRTVLDRVVSSYTATVRGLARSRAHRRRTRPGARTAIIAVPEAPGAAPLDGAAVEAKLLTGLVPGAEVLPNPTRASVLAALPDHPVAHFACHGEPHRIDPWRGRLILPDHQTDPLTVADIGALRLEGGLAFLSACSTAMTVLQLADEALHLTGAFQLAGYPHVVGTQWPVADRPAHRLVTDFYGRLTTDGTTPPDPTRAAEALHHATRALRARYRLTPALWAAHTHTGA